MPVVCLGLSHHTAPVDVRERHAFPASRMAEALTALRDYPSVVEAAMLQTCGRLEIYAELEEYEAGIEQLKAFLANFRHGATGYDLESYLYTLLGRDAVHHLMRVCTGLDSMLIGEAEILGQVKDAYVQAHHANAIGSTLHRLFRDALNAGKTARTRTRIGDESTSIATAAIDLATTRLGSLHDASVLVIGTGKMGRTAARRLRSAGAKRLILTNRTMQRAQELIAEIGFGDAIEMPHLPDALAAADVVVTSTGSSEFVVEPDTVRAAMSRRPERPLFIVDIAVPRDVDPDVGQIDNVTLIDVDGLKTVVDEKLEVRREAIPHVEAIIADYVENFARWYRSRAAVPVIASLTQKAEAIREGEIEKLLARLPDLSEREKQLIVGSSMTIVSKLLHSAITRMRDKAERNQSEAIEHARVLDDLFELNVVADGDE